MIDTHYRIFIVFLALYNICFLFVLKYLGTENAIIENPISGQAVKCKAIEHDLLFIYERIPTKSIKFKRFMSKTLTFRALNCSEVLFLYHV